MLALSEELAQAHRELETWVRLHATEGDEDLDLWRALSVIKKAGAWIRKQEASSSATG